MIGRKLIGLVLKYLPFIGILALSIFSLYHGITTLTDEADRNIRILTDILLIVAVVGDIGSFLVIDQFNIALSGKSLNFFQDIWEESSQDIAVKYNELIVLSLLIPVINILYIIFFATGIRFFSNVAIILAAFWSIGMVVDLFAEYLKMKHLYPKSTFSHLLNPLILPAIIGIIQILITQENWVGYIYHNIYNPKNDIILTLVLIIVLCYFLAVSFCHFSNAYCLIGLCFIKRDPDKIQQKINLLQETKENQEIILRQVTNDIDTTAEQISSIKKIGLIFRFFSVHIKTYAQRRRYSVLYLLSLFHLKIMILFHGLLDPAHIRLNSIRFCLVTAVLELLSLDLFLFIYLESNSPCLKFFELFSTVIIIPILLSWLAELKSKAEKY